MQKLTNTYYVLVMYHPSVDPDVDKLYIPLELVTMNGTSTEKMQPSVWQRWWTTG
jgi:hypothetical protein